MLINRKSFCHLLFLDTFDGDLRKRRKTFDWFCNKSHSILFQLHSSTVMQDTAVVPPSASYGDAQSQEFSPWSWVKTPKGALRIVEFILSIVMFATMADVENFDVRSEFKYMVACGVIVWLYVTIMMILYICRKTVDRYCLYMPIIELVFDGIFCVMLLAAGAASASECNADQGFGSTICKDAPTKVKDNIKASIVFAFFTLIAFIASTFFSYKENVEEERKK